MVVQNVCASGVGSGAVHLAPLPSIASTVTGTQMKVRDNL